MTGRTIGNYRIVDKLGEGAMGKVYRAIDLMLEREVAMKALKVDATADRETTDRFRSEAVTLARLNHPCIAQLYAFFRDAGEFYMVMEYVPGENLESRLARTGAMPWTEAFHLTRLILEGLGHAHSQGILHRDIKPANIMLPAQGGVKITDFGIAQMMAGGPKMTREGRVVGTLEYLAPERIQGAAVGPSSDLYAAGVVLYEMITGRLPFSSTSEYELLTAHVHQQPPPLSQMGVSLPGNVEAAIMRALAKDPAARYPDAASFSAALAGLLASWQPAAPPPIPGAAGIWRRRAESFLAPKQNRAFLAGAAGVFALILVAIGVNRIVNPPVDPWKVTPPPAVEPAPAPKTPDSPAIPEPAPVAIPYNPAPQAPVELPPTAPVEVAPPKPAPAPVAAPKPASLPNRGAVLDALNRTDGPVTGPAGSHPIHLAGMVAALRLGAPSMLGDIRAEVVRRGVNFQLSQTSASQLAAAGATPELIETIRAQYRGAPEPAPIAPAPPPQQQAPSTPIPVPAPKPAEPEPVRPIVLLSEVHKVFVEKMPGELDELIIAELDREMGARLKTQRARAGADAVLKLQVEEKSGGTVSRAGRILGIQDRVRTSAVLLDRSGKVILWQHEVGDKKPIVGAFRDKDMERIAQRVVRELRKAFR